MFQGVGFSLLSKDLFDSGANIILRIFTCKVLGDFFARKIVFYVVILRCVLKINHLPEGKIRNLEKKDKKIQAIVGKAAFVTNH